MKEKLFTDTEKAAEMWDNCQNALPAIQRVIDEFKKTECEFTMPELWDIIKHKTKADTITAAVMDKKLQNETPQIFGIKLSRPKLLEMIEIENLNEIQAAISEANGLSWEIQNYVKIKNGVAYIDSSTRKEIDDRFTIYATTAVQLQKAELIKAAAKTLNELITLGVIKNHSMVYAAPQLDGLKVVSGENGWTFAPDINKIKTIIEG